MIFKNKNFKKNSQKKGVALLFSILLSAVLFTVATGIIKIALEEVKFNPPLRDTGEAFFAADIGAECAMYNDTPGALNEEETNNIPNINCVFKQGIGFITTNPWTFVIDELGNSGNACAFVTINKNFTADPVETTIVSRGEAFGNSTCDQSADNRAERVIEVNY